MPLSKVKKKIKMKQNIQHKFSKRKGVRLEASKIYLENILKPACNLVRVGDKLIPDHRERPITLMTYHCNDSRKEDCPYSYKKNDIAFCRYK